jgi:hypothetical protein
MGGGITGASCGLAGLPGSDSEPIGESPPFSRIAKEL